MAFGRLGWSGPILTFKNIEMNETNEMPKYKCHKEVWAIKIKSIVRDGDGENRESDGSAIVTPEEKECMGFKVDAKYMHKHKPVSGGYYVKYKDGYESFSPADVFESGYVKILEKKIEASAEEISMNTLFPIAKVVNQAIKAHEELNGTFNRKDWESCDEIERGLAIDQVRFYLTGTRHNIDDMTDFGKENYKLFCAIVEALK